jgi:hypothetical protein
VAEQKWLACNDPTLMLEYLCSTGITSDRKLRLFACACCRRIWHRLFHQDSFTGIEVGERFAEGQATDEELRTADELAMWAGDDASQTSMQDAVNAWAAVAPVQATGISAARSAVWELQRVFSENKSKCGEERAAQCHLLRCIFANPFRPILAIDPDWLAWNGGVVVRLAQATYDERKMPEGALDAAAVAVLADALEEAGADSLLSAHLRQQQGDHVRGCWVIDLLLDTHEANP